MFLEAYRPRLLFKVAINKKPPKMGGLLSINDEGLAKGNRLRPEISGTAGSSRGS